MVWLLLCHFDDYLTGKIKKHELTRPDKEEDRMIHVRNQQANIEPVFFSYPAVEEMDRIVRDIVENQEAEYDFTAATDFVISLGDQRQGGHRSDYADFCRGSGVVCGRRTPPDGLLRLVSDRR